MMTQSQMSSRWVLITLCVLTLTFIGCDTESTDQDTNGGTLGEMTGGTTGGMTGGATGGMTGGTTGGMTGGVTGGVTGGTTGGATGGTDITEPDEMGRIDPDAPLPTPKVTTHSPPEELARPGEGEMPSDCTGAWVNEVRGWIVDETGEPLEGAKAQLCIRLHPSRELICLMPQNSSENGFFSIPVSTSAQCLSEATLRSLIPREAFASMYCHTDLSQLSDDGVLRINDPLVLYETRPATDREEVGDGSSPKNLTLLGDLNLTLIPNDLYGPDFDRIGGRPVPLDGPGLCFLETDEEMPLDGLFTFYPEGDIFESNASLKFPNTADYSPMTEVALYVLGNLDCSIIGKDEGLEEANWEQFGVGVVDASGMWIESSMEEGLPCLSWFGYGPITTP